MADLPSGSVAINAQFFKAPDGSIYQYFNSTDRFVLLYTAEQIDEILGLFATINYVYAGDLTNANAIISETNRAIAVENTKADIDDILTPINITYAQLDASKSSYTNSYLIDKTVSLIYASPNGVFLLILTADSSGKIELGFTANSDFVGVIQGASGVLADYVKISTLFDIEIGKNKFDKTDVISGFYVNGAGALVGNAPSKTSQWIPIDATLAYYISGRSTGNVRLRDASGTILPPNNADGTPRTDYTTAPSAGNDGIIYPPPTAIEVQFTCILNSGTMDNIQLEVGTVQTSYAPYSESYIIKSELIPELPYITEDVLTPLLDLKVDKSFLLYDQIGKNKFDKTKNITGKYISTVDGSLQNSGTSQVSEWIEIDNTVPYYISGRTTGGVRFRNLAGDILPNNNANGTPRTDWSTSPSGANDGILYPPSDAIEVQFTSVLSGNGNVNIQQLEEGTAQTSYEAYSSTPLIKPSVLPPSQVPSYNFKVVKDTGYHVVRTNFDDVYDIRLRLTTVEYNGLYNIARADLLLKSDNDGVVGTQINGAGSDDSAPSFFNGNKLYGGDHAGDSYKLTATAHGKTLADVGAIYTDANGNRYVIFKIEDVNNITFVVENTGSSTAWNFPAPVSPMTYTSDGNSTTGITFTASSLLQLYPSVKNVVQKLFIDGEYVTDNGTYYGFGNKISFLESYDIVDYVDFVSKLTSDRPFGGYLTQPLATNGDAIVNITTVFDVHKKGTVTMSCAWTNLKVIALNYFGITQSAFVTPSWATTVRKYAPKVLPIINNGNIYDFRLMPDFKTPTITGEILITSTYWEDGKVTNRFVDMLQSSSLNVNFNLGYLPLGDDRQDMVNTAWRMTSSKKAYPKFIDEKINVSGLLPINTIKQGFVYRGWSIPTGMRTNDILVELGGKYYLNLDYHNIGIDTYYLPTELDGKMVTVLDKSANVTLLTSVVSGCIMIGVATSTPMYGYCELLIS